MQFITVKKDDDTQQVNPAVLQQFVDLGYAVTESANTLKSVIQTDAQISEPVTDTLESVVNV